MSKRMIKVQPAPQKILLATNPKNSAAPSSITALEVEPKIQEEQV